MKRWRAQWAFLLALAGCGQQPKHDQAPQNTVSAWSDPKALPRLETMPDGERSAVLFRAITDSNASCARVTRSAYQQRYRGMAMFVARCDAGTPFAVFVGDKGYAQVTSCPTLAPAVPACRLDLLDSKPR